MVTIFTLRARLPATPTQAAAQARPAPGLLEVIKLIVQVFDEVLEERYARGEINREEYLQKKRDIT